jgi:hypothetical protein
MPGQPCGGACRAPRPVAAIAWATVLALCAIAGRGIEAASVEDALVAAVSPFAEGGSATAREVGLGELSAVATPGEFESLSFTVRASTDVGAVTVKPGDLVGAGRPIAASNVEVWVVKVWAQAGRGVRPMRSVTVPELLLKDDDASLSDGWDASGRYTPPDVRLSGDVKTRLKAWEAKRLWLTIRVPEAASPGDYRGNVTLEVDGGPMKRQVPIRLSVLPLKLKEPRQDRVIYYRGSLDPRRTVDFVGPERFRADVKDIKAHGFTGLTIYDNDPRFAGEAFAIAAAEGLRGPLVFTEPDPKLLEVTRGKGIEVLFYGVDEPNDDTRIRNHIERAKRLRAGGGRVVTAISRQWAARLGAPGDLNERLTVANLGMTPDFFEWVQDRGASGRESIGDRVWYYWQVMMEKPGLHRLLSGFYVWRSGLDGIFPYAYQHLSNRTSPFDDFAKSSIGNFRAIMGTYPARRGPIPTVQWEAVREGIDDLRCVMTLEDLIARGLKSGNPTVLTLARSTQERLAAIKSKIRVTELPLASDTVLDPIKGVGPADYESWSRTCLEAAVRLNTALEGSHGR